MAAKLFLARRLETRLVLAVGLGMLIFSLVAGLYTYDSTYRQEIQATRDLERQLVATVQTQAEVALYAYNLTIAQGVLDGLAATPIIRAARIDSSDLIFTAERGFNPGEERVPAASGTSYALYSPFNHGERLGTLTIVADEAIVRHRARDSALHQTFLLLVQVLLVAGIMIIVLRGLLVRPIARLSRDLARLQPGGAGRLAVGEIHEADELGQLAQSANLLLDATEQAMRELNTVNESLADALARLGERDEAKSRFFAAASHDLRQPIHAINLFLDAMVQSDGQEVRARLIDSIRTALTTLRELLESLLDISKLDAGAVAPQFEWVPAEAFFERLDNNISPLALQRRLRFKLWFPHRPLLIRTDPRLFNSVLANIAGNAIKNTHSGGILVSLRRRRDSWVFQIWDTGVGIAPEYLDRIYDEFFQVDNPGRDRAMGLGLGLAISRRIVRLLGYALRCRSTVGRGTCFEIVLPAEYVRVESVRSEAIAAPQPANFSSMRGKRLVVMEDDRLVAQALAAWLEACGCRVEMYRSGEDALVGAALAAADYFIVDDQLAGRMSGIEFLQAVETKLGRSVRAVVVTGNTSTRFIEATEHAPWPILFKPVEPMEILARLTG